MRRKSSIPVENKAAKEAAKNKMFAALSRKTGLTAKEVNIHFFYFNFFNKKKLEDRTHCKRGGYHSSHHRYK